MEAMEIRDLTSENLFYVARCTHGEEEEETAWAAQVRGVWLTSLMARGCGARWPIKATTLWVSSNTSP